MWNPFKKRSPSVKESLDRMLNSGLDAPISSGLESLPALGFQGRNSEQEAEDSAPIECERCSRIARQLPRFCFCREETQGPCKWCVAMKFGPLKRSTQTDLRPADPAKQT